LLFAAFGRRRWAGGPGWGGKGWGGPGWGPRYGGWYGPGHGPAPVDPNDPQVREWLDKAPPELQTMLEAWHRQAHGSSGSTAADGPSALASARTKGPDLVVLDLGLPRMDGLDVARSIRRDSAVPIIMLTARADESDTLIGLELGADDYLTKPFSPKELVARV